jgi:hypothetical protein
MNFLGSQTGFSQLAREPINFVASLIIVGLAVAVADSPHGYFRSSNLGQESARLAL